MTNLCAALHSIANIYDFIPIYFDIWCSVTNIIFFLLSVVLYFPLRYINAKQSTTSMSQGAARSVSLDEQEDNQKTVLLFGPSGHWLVLGPGKEIKKPDSDLRHHFHLQSPET